MRKQMVLTLLSCLGLMAESHAAPRGPRVSCEPAECCAPCKCCKPCEPCCVPQPKKCIDCECYTPAFYDLQCDWGVFVSLDFLYWYARETNLTYAAQGDSPTQTDGTIVESAASSLKNFGTSWDPGVRLGLGMNSSCDGWDVYLDWTYYHNQRKDSASVPDVGATNTDDLSPNRSFLSSYWIGNFEGFGELGNLRIFDEIQAKWSLTFNQLDLELGRKYWLSRCFALRPYAGIRAAWVKTVFQVNGSLNTFDPLAVIPGGETIALTSKNNYTNRSWGLGMLAGLQPTWYFCQNFALYSNFEAALISGNFHSKYKQNDEEQRLLSTNARQSTSFTHQTKNNFSMIQASIDLGLGLRWEEAWCSDRYRTTLDIGWENHIWFDYSHRPIPVALYVQPAGNLMMGGLIVRARLDF